MQSRLFFRMSQVATILALCVVLLGAYTRLSDAGLGCPDWPGCYGHIDVPESSHEVARANEAYPHRPVEAAKAWKEMIHRYFAGALGLLILAITVMALRNYRNAAQSVALPLWLTGLVIFQALLGMWTVTLLVKPLVVTAHLLGGMAVLALLWLLALKQGDTWSRGSFPREQRRAFRGMALIALLVVIVQIFLGGWTSTNYAALACTDFPTCGGSFWPQMDFKEGFVLWRGLGINYEFGVLEDAARKAIHMVHRLGALITLIVVGAVALRAIKASHDAAVNKWGWIILVLLLLQISLGIGNVLLSLPLAVAVAHNGIGALLLLSLVTLNYGLRVESKV